jgi:glycosyltransferase involved in cell wall biosynthesis
MIIAIISEWFSEGMGYAENYFPVSLSKIGCEVHSITSDLQIYATDNVLYKNTYEAILGPPSLPIGQKQLNGFILHRLRHYRAKYGIGINGLFEKLSEIRPDIVYLFEINSETTLQAVEYKSILKYKIFTESRLHLSVYNPPNTLRNKLKHYYTETLFWKKIGKSFDRCYPIAPDVLYIICKYYGQNKKKCRLVTLGVDTTIFKPITTDAEILQRKELRSRFNYSDEDIICIYSGRFTDDKGTLLLAKAIEYLQKQGKSHFKGLFVGTGEATYLSEIKDRLGCTIHPFVSSSTLVKFYHASDIGVWPKQESTSQLDAAACGLPIIISSSVEDMDRIKDNGLNYKDGDAIDLANKISSLESIDLRKTLGEKGSKKIQEYYSWDYIAKLRLKEFCE